MQQKFDIGKAPVPPLRAEPRLTQPTGAGGHIQGVEATPGGLIRSTLMASVMSSSIGSIRIRSRPVSRSSSQSAVRGPNRWPL